MNVHVRGHAFRLVQRSNTQEAQMVVLVVDQVIAPERDLAFVAAGNALSAPAGRVEEKCFDLAELDDDPIRLYQCVDRVGGAGLSLAQATVAGVDDQGRRGHVVPDGTAGASAFAKCVSFGHPLAGKNWRCALMGHWKVFRLKIFERP